MQKNFYNKYLKNIYFLTFIFLALFISIFLVKYFDFKNKIEFASCNINTSVEKFEKFNDAFNLIHEDGFKISRKKLIDQPSLLYFGYTFCPDICPLDTMRNAEAVDYLAEKGISATPVFISIDPARDTPQVVGKFAAFMHPKMIGLTGSEEQIKAASHAYRTYYKAHDSGDEFYLVDHSTMSYLVLPDHGVVEFFRREVAPDALAEKAACFINKS